MKEQRNQSPPSGPLRILNWFCPPPLLEGIEGDLVEQFEADVARWGRRAARRRMFLNTFRFFQPAIIMRNRFVLRLINTIMLDNYFKVAARNIGKRKLYSFINAFGLSIGIAFCVLIWMFVADEKSFDQFHANKDRIYRIEVNSYNYWNPSLDEADRWQREAHLQVGFKQAMVDEIPEVEHATRFSEGRAIVKVGDKVFTEQITFVDADFFKMYSFRLLSGNVVKVFESKHEIVMTPEMAAKYFGMEDPIGKIVQVDISGEQSYTVTGITEAPPANSSLDFRILVPQQNRDGYDRQMTRWGSFSTPTFVQVAPGTDMGQFEAKLQKVMDKNVGPTLLRWRKEANLGDDAKIMEYKFRPLSDMHLTKEIGWHKVSDPQYSYILGGIALLILVIACINYVSLALTTSAARRMEVGIRKVVGALTKQLLYQFSIESILLAFISALLGVGMVILFLPWFNQFTGKGIEVTYQTGLGLVGIATAIGVVVGLLAGSYPALFLSRFLPALVLKGSFTARVQAGFTRPLVVFQFWLSAILIISSVIMYRQMGFVTNRDLGYNKDQVLVIPTQATDGNQSDVVVAQMRTRLSQESGILNVAGTSISFNQGWSRNGYKIDGENKSSYVYGVDPHYVPALGLELVMGRNFDERIATDSNAVIVNEALVKDMKWSDPLNSYLNWKEDTTTLGAKVIGVVRDYHYRSLEAPIDPLLLTMDLEAAGHLTTIIVRMAPGNVQRSMGTISTLWKETYPDKPYDYTFLDEDVAKQYESQKRWMSVMGVATSFAILISCLGLFGLAGINAVNRTKEIGIRRVMGAEVSNIFVMLNKQYVWLSLIAFSLAIPVSYYVMDKWLSDFKFHIEMSWDLFAFSVLSGLAVALITVSYHAIRVAMVNPAQTLKYE